MSDTNLKPYNDAVNYERIQQMSPANKYALFTEVQFLLAQKHAKIDYLDVTGFPLIKQVITGIQRKGKKQIIKNSQKIQEIFHKLLEQLDSEIQDLKIQLSKTNKKVDTTFHMALDSLLFNIDLIDRNDLNYDEELYDRMIHDVEAAELQMIEEINEIMPPAVPGFRILRLLPLQRAILTEMGPEITELEPDKNSEQRDNLISQTNLLTAAARGPYDAVILPYGAESYGIITKQVLDFNDYQMLHYLHVRKPSAGQQIAMIDYYNCMSYISGYIVSENGTYQSVFKNKGIERKRTRTTHRDNVYDFFRNSGITPDNVIFAKSFSLRTPIENKYGKVEIDNFKLDEQWLCNEPQIIRSLLGG